jgi:hypothetical protein
MWVPPSKKDTGFRRASLEAIMIETCVYVRGPLVLREDGKRVHMTTQARKKRQGRLFKMVPVQCHVCVCLCCALKFTYVRYQEMSNKIDLFGRDAEKRTENTIV